MPKGGNYVRRNEINLLWDMLYALSDIEQKNGMAERAGFEPAWDCSQTDFESAPL